MDTIKITKQVHCEDIRMVNAELYTEEIYTHSVQGSWNISQVQRHINSGLYNQFLLKIAITQNIIEMNEVGGVVEAHLDRMPAERLTVPCIMLGVYRDDPNAAIMADGNHRLRKLIRMGCKAFPAYFIPYDLCQQYHCWMEAKVGGVWYKVDDSDLPDEFADMDPMAVDREKLRREWEARREARP